MSMRAGIYIRVSTEEQAKEGFSLGAQEERLRAYAKSQDWTVLQVYTDDGYSGASLERPALKRLLRDVREKLLDVVLVYRLDRLSRRQKDVLYLLEDVFEPSGIGFKSATEPFDTTTPFGKATLGMLAVFAQLERDTIRQRTMMGRHAAVAKGRWKGGKTPYGYRREGTTVIPYPPEALVVRQIFQWYMEGAGRRDIVNRCRDAGFPRPEGGKWAQWAVDRILDNAIYAGFVEMGGQTYEGTHEAIVPRDLFDQVRAKRLRSRADSTRHRTDRYLLTGLIYCGVCGNRMYGRHSRKAFDSGKTWENDYYYCRTRLYQYDYEKADRRCDNGYHRADEVEAEIVRQLSMIGMDESIRQEETDAVLREGRVQDRFEVELASIQGARDALDKRAQRWLDAFDQGAIDAAMLGSRLQGIQKEREALERQLDALRAELHARETREDAQSELLPLLREIGPVWQAASKAERRSLVLQLVRRIVVNRDGSVTVDSAC